MVKLAAAILALAGFAVPVVDHASPASPRTVEQQLLERVNGGPSGTITRRVHCRSAGERLSCTLEGLSLRSPARLRVEVVARGRSLQTRYGSVQG